MWPPDRPSHKHLHSTIIYTSLIICWSLLSNYIISEVIQNATFCKIWKRTGLKYPKLRVSANAGAIYYVTLWYWFSNSLELFGFVLKIARVHFVTNNTFGDLKFTSLIFKTKPSNTLDRNENVPMYIRGLRIHLKEEKGILGGMNKVLMKSNLFHNNFGALFPRKPHNVLSCYLNRALLLS